MSRPDYGPCVFEGCNKPSISPNHKLCAGHYGQKYRGEELRTLRVRRASQLDIEGYRRCTSCNKVKEEAENFYLNNNNLYRSKCKACSSRDNRARTLERLREAQSAN